MQALALALVLAAAATPEPPASRTFMVDAAASSVTVAVGRSGVFGFAGHEHQVLATAVEGRIEARAAEVAKSSVALRFLTAGLRVSGKGEPPADVPKVQAKMESAEVLDVGRFPEVTFLSTVVEGRQAPDGTWNLRVTGQFALKGIARALTLPLRVRIDGDTLTATGQAVIRQADFGIRPVSVGGVVKVRNEVGVDYKIVAKAAP